MATIPQIKKQTISIKKRIEDVDASYYTTMFKRIDAFNKKNKVVESKEKDEEAKWIISNFIYLIHERLELKFARKVNYKMIRTWAAENYEMVAFLLSSHFPEFDLESFEKWTQPEIPLMSIGLYDRSTADTKDLFH